MIILENDDSPSTLQSKSRDPESSRTSFHARDINDLTTETLAVRAFPHLHDESPPPPYTNENEPLLLANKPGRRARRRFMKALGVALLMFLGCGICFNAMLYDITHIHDHERIPRASPIPTTPPENPGFSEKVIRCVELIDSTPSNTAFTEDGGTAKGTLQIGAANFHLPSTSDSFFFISDGSVVGQIVISPESDDSKAVHVDVLRTSRLDNPPLVHICILERRDGSVGIGVLNPAHDHDTPDSRVNYVFSLKFPATTKHPRQYSSFDVAAPFLMNVFAEMDGAVSFESVSINSRNTSSVIGSLYADRINITHTEGSIFGSLRATSLVALSSSGELINVNIDLHGGDEAKSTQLSLFNAHNALHANIRLLQQKKCETVPHSHVAFPTSIPRPRPMLSLPPPVHPNHDASTPYKTVEQRLQSSPLHVSSDFLSTPTACSPPSYSVHALSDTGLILNIMSPSRSPSRSLKTDGEPSLEITPLLRLSAKATLGSATLTLPAVYEGLYDVRGRLAVMIDDSPEDPSGRGRTRRFRKYDEREDMPSGSVEVSADEVLTSTTPNQAIGKVWWGEEPSEVAERSRVSVRATRMAYLHFGE